MRGRGKGHAPLSEGVRPQKTKLSNKNYEKTEQSFASQTKCNTFHERKLLTNIQFFSALIFLLLGAIMLFGSYYGKVFNLILLFFQVQ